VLLKIVLLAYSKGIISSRGIEAACRSNVQFMAICGDSHPHDSTIASCVSKLGPAIAKIFAQVLHLCQREGLIGGAMFAIDGVKLPSNASKAKSGTRQDDLRHLSKMELAAQRMIERQRKQDAKKGESGVESDQSERRLARLQREAEQLREWLAANPNERAGCRGSVRLSNRTDNESAKMAMGKGVIQGYSGVAAVDEKAQVIVAAQAQATGSEQERLAPMMEEIKPRCGENSMVSADSGYCSKKNLEVMEAERIDAFLPSTDYRRGDPRYAGHERHTAKPDALWDKRAKEEKPKLFQAQQFKRAADLLHGVCPAGKRLYRNGGNCDIGGHKAIKFTGARRVCQTCTRRTQCLRHPDKTPVRQVAILQGKSDRSEETALDRMKRKIDSAQGREMITRRFATLEPVFGNIRNHKRLNRFSLRGRAKVDSQWELYCLVHNIEKLAHHGYGQ
jgi:hypothetical protein